MDTYETSATVEDQGHIHLAGLPFAPGTAVEVTIREKASQEEDLDARVPMKNLFARVRARNTVSVGPVKREELYDRKVLVDTNVLVYAASSASEDKDRSSMALEWLDRTDLAISAQVLAEFYSVATSKAKLNLTHEEAMVLLQAVSRIPVCPITRDLVMEAADVRQRYGISYWDAAIIAAAKQMVCHTLYSEDLNPGQVYDGVTVINPFS